MRQAPTSSHVRARRVRGRGRGPIRYGALVAGLVAATMLGGSPPAGAVAGPADDWKQYRYDATRSAFSSGETNLDVHDVGRLRLLWFKGPAQTNVVVEHGHVLSCASGSCYDRRIDFGQLVWRSGTRVHGVGALVAEDQLWSQGALLRVRGMQLSDGTATVSFGQPGGLAAPVAADAGRIFGSGNHGHVNAYPTRPGTTGWTSAKLLSLGVTATPGPPAVGVGRVFVAACDAVAAFRETDGRFRWYAAVPAPTGGCSQMPVVTAGRVVAATTALTALDPTSGARLWSTPGDGGPLQAPAAAYGRVFAVAPAAGTIAAYDVTDGRRLWSTPTDATGPPSIANGVVYAIGPSGLHTFDATSGEPVATLPGTFRGEVVIAEGDLLVDCTDPVRGSGICVYGVDQ